MVSVHRVPQMQGVGYADVLLYFKCPTIKQMRYPVNAYESLAKEWLYERKVRCERQTLRVADCRRGFLTGIGTGALCVASSGRLFAASVDNKEPAAVLESRQS
jgi:hypothetical protein